MRYDHLRLSLFRHAGRAATALLLASVPVSAQSASAGSGRNEIFVGSELERYLRVLQLRGQSELYPWSIRSFSPVEVDRILPRDSVHPWAGRYGLEHDTVSGRIQVGMVSPRAWAIYNSAFPHGSNDGPVWAGRGITMAVQAGFSGRAGPLSLTLAPIAFRAENAAFDLAPVQQQDAQVPFEDWRYPNYIDLPQRFGNDAYTRIDPGQSTLRLDFPFVALGVSTANQHWGPASQYPLVLGNNAPGFLHGFIGTSTPLFIGVGRLHGRAVWGVLDQSEYSRVHGPGARRFMSGLVAVFTPRGLSGLELGGARFFHTPWPEAGLSGTHFLKPFEGFLKAGLRPREFVGDSLSDADNQIASLFGRWVFPGSGFELYGEYSRDDHNYDLRDLLLEPDHNSGYMLGFRKLWRPSPRQIVALRGETLDTRISHLSEVRIQVPLYTHFGASQGHTQRGEIIGSPAGYGGAGGMLAADYYHKDGRWTLEWTRMVRQDAGEVRDSAQVPAYSDVLHSVGVEALLFRGRVEMVAGMAGVYNLNRNFGSDRFNLHSQVGLRFGF